MGLPDAALPDTVGPSDSEEFEVGKGAVVVDPDCDGPRGGPVTVCPEGPVEGALVVSELVDRPGVPGILTVPGVTLGPMGKVELG